MAPGARRGCPEIREQLATLNGSALRRAPIRRHLALCPTCAAFEGEVKRQRAALALLLPVIPSAGLKPSVLTATLSAGHGAAAAGAGGTVAAGAAASGVGAGASGLTVKALVVAALAVGGGGGAVAVHELDQPRPVERPTTTTPRRPPVAAAVAAPVAAAGERRPGIPAASHRRAATIDSPGRKTRHPRRRGTQDIPRRVERRVAARSGRRRAAPRVGGGRRRAVTPAGSARRRAARGRRTRNSSGRQVPPGARDASPPACGTPDRHTPSDAADFRARRGATARFGARQAGRRNRLGSLSDQPSSRERV